MKALCPVCKQPFTSAPLFLSRSCFRPDPSEGRGVSGRNLSPVDGAGDGGEASAPLSSLGLPANPSSTARIGPTVEDGGKGIGPLPANSSGVESKSVARRKAVQSNPSGDIPSSVKESGGVRHRVPGPFDGDC